MPDTDRYHRRSTQSALGRPAHHALAGVTDGAQITTEDPSRLRRQDEYHVVARAHQQPRQVSDGATRTAISFEVTTTIGRQPVTGNVSDFPARYAVEEWMPGRTPSQTIVSKMPPDAAMER